MQNLLKLQTLEFGEVTGKGTESQIPELRTQIPSQILGHYDRLRAREKKGMAMVRNQVCTGCHMRQPVAKVNVLMRGEDIQLCDTCGRYLYLSEEPEAPAAEAAPVEKPAEKPARKPRKRKVVAQAV